ncbi:biotin-dependent carboxyltransferase family protein [Flavobacteriaceae bacterium F08102]|nr:biotin-dependent carboxyltransferase family protein [Flavobacteriaceae bacterium F08102]
MIIVNKPGFYTTIQDLGRFGYRRFGVPVSGVMDEFSAAMANAILGNKPEDAVLEIALGNVELLFDIQTVICISGANFSPTLNGRGVSMNSPVGIHPGDVLRFKFPRNAALGYLAVAGGIQTEIVMRSRSLLRGVTKFACLAGGMRLPIRSLSEMKLVLGGLKEVDDAHFNASEISVMPGPEFDHLRTLEKSAILTRFFTLSRDCNRIGFRMAETIAYVKPSPMLTGAVMPGTVQLTPSGGLIVLMKDCQVTGGYPRVLQLTPSGISRLAQKRPGDKIRFKLV